MKLKPDFITQDIDDTQFLVPVGAEAFNGVVRSNSTALTVVITSTSGISFVSPATAATAMAPNATCESPSPMKEKRFSTSVTPNSDEQSAIRTPTISAYLTNGYCR